MKAKITKKSYVKTIKCSKLMPHERRKLLLIELRKHESLIRDLRSAIELWPRYDNPSSDVIFISQTQIDRLGDFSDQMCKYMRGVK